MIGYPPGPSGADQVSVAAPSPPAAAKSFGGPGSVVTIFTATCWPALQFGASGHQ